MALLQIKHVKQLHVMVPYLLSVRELVNNHDDMMRWRVWDSSQVLQACEPRRDQTLRW